MADKKPKGIYSKGEGASNFVPSPYSKTGADKFIDVVSAAVDTTETKQDRANLKSIIAAAGRKYKIDQKEVTKTIKAVEEENKGTQDGHAVTKVDRKTGRASK